MLTFFRRIRKGLLDMGAARKPASPAGRYLLYAAGEVLLVMVGILLALQVNNWNEARKQSSLENHLLSRLMEDLSTDNDRLQYLDTSYFRIIKETHKSIHLFTQAKTVDDVREMIHLPRWIGRNLSMQMSTFDEMVNSGTLYTITDGSLLNAITNHYKNAEKYDIYTRENYQSISDKWNIPEFAPFGIITLQYANETEDEFVDISWIGLPNHPTYQAARFALENNLKILRLNHSIVKFMHEGTLEIIDRIKIYQLNR